MPIIHKSPWRRRRDIDLRHGTLPNDYENNSDPIIKIGDDTEKA